MKLFHRIYWFSSINLNQVGKKQAPSVSCRQFFISSKLLGVCAKEKFGLFELLNTTLTGPNRLVDKRAGVVIKTTVIEPQLVTAPPACFLLGPGIKTQQRCVWALSQLHTESKNWLSEFHGCSRIFFPTFWGDVASPHTLVVLLWFYVSCYRWGQKWNHKKTWIFNYQLIENTEWNKVNLLFFYSFVLGKFIIKFISKKSLDLWQHPEVYRQACTCYKTYINWNVWHKVALLFADPLSVSISIIRAKKWLNKQRRRCVRVCLWCGVWRGSTNRPLPEGLNIPRGLIGFQKLESATLAEVGPALLADAAVH